VIRHIFLGTVRDGASDHQLEELIQAWSTMPGRVPGLRRLTAGRNVSPRDRRYSLALVADLDDMRAWEGYMEHPEHLAIIDRLSSKLIEPESRTMVQLEVADG
jgi:Stress responsive A/B Barrel Domain